MINQKQKGVSSLSAIVIVIAIAVLVIGTVLAYQYYWQPSEKETEEETPEDETALKEIAYRVFDEYLKSYTSPDIPLERRLKNYLIEYVSATAVREDCFAFSVQFSVEPFIDLSIAHSDWEAGNGEVSGNWVEHKNMVGEIIKEGNDYKIKSMGTGRARPACQ